MLATLVTRLVMDLPRVCRGLHSPVGVLRRNLLEVFEARLQETNGPAAWTSEVHALLHVLSSCTFSACPAFSKEDRRSAFQDSAPAPNPDPIPAPPPSYSRLHPPSSPSALKRLDSQRWQRKITAHLLQTVSLHLYLRRFSHLLQVYECVERAAFRGQTKGSSEAHLPPLAFCVPCFHFCVCFHASPSGDGGGFTRNAGRDRPWGEEAVASGEGRTPPLETTSLGEWWVEAALRKCVESGAPWD